MSESIAIFAAGCFWGVEERFLSTPGVIRTQVGYIGGSNSEPTYQEVCTGTTGHAEAVEVCFDPEKVSFAQLAELFFGMHDPTTLNRQGPDRGTQYRSAIFVLDEAQKEQAQMALSKAQGNWSQAITTEIASAATFWSAEEYHQQYLRKQGRGS